MQEGKYEFRKQTERVQKKVINRADLDRRMHIEGCRLQPQCSFHIADLEVSE